MAESRSVLNATKSFPIVMFKIGCFIFLFMFQVFLQLNSDTLFEMNMQL